MIITWIDKKSVFGTGKKSYRFGDKIPSGLLSEGRMSDLKKAGKILIKEDPTPCAKIINNPVIAPVQIIPAKPEKLVRKKVKSKEEVKEEIKDGIEVEKSKSVLDEEELQRLIEEEESNK